jgi:hypothetical protein
MILVRDPDLIINGDFNTTEFWYLGLLLRERVRTKNNWSMSYSYPTDPYPVPWGAPLDIGRKKWPCRIVCLTCARIVIL